MTNNLFTIEDLEKGKCGIINDGGDKLMLHLLCKIKSKMIGYDNQRFYAKEGVGVVNLPLQSARFFVITNEATEIFDDLCYVQHPIPNNEKVTVYYPNAIAAMNEYADQKVIKFIIDNALSVESIQHIIDDFIADTNGEVDSYPLACVIVHHLKHTIK